MIGGQYGNSFTALKASIKLKTSGGKSNEIHRVTVPNADPSNDNAFPKLYAPALPKKMVESTLESSDPEAKDSQPATNPTYQQMEMDEFKSALNNALEVMTDPLGAITAYGLHLTSMRVKELNDQEQASEQDGKAGTDDAEGTEQDGTNGAGGEVGDEAADEATYVGDSTSKEGLDGDETGEDEAGAVGAAETATPVYEGVFERALLTEAAFVMPTELGPDMCDKLGYFK